MCAFGWIMLTNDKPHTWRRLEKSILLEYVDIESVDDKYWLLACGLSVMTAYNILAG